MSVLLGSAGSVGGVVVVNAQVVKVQADGARAVKVVSRVEPPKCSRMILRINMAGILGRLCEKTSHIPLRPRVKRLESVESEWDVWRCASRNESPCSKAHAKAPDAQRKALVFGKPGNDFKERKLQ